MKKNNCEMVIRYECTGFDDCKYCQKTETEIKCDYAECEDFEYTACNNMEAIEEELNTRWEK